MNRLALAFSAVLLFAACPKNVENVSDDAMADIAKKYGNKKSSELSQDERRDMIQEQRAAENAVMEKNGVDPKEMARYEAKMNLADRAATKTEREKLDQKAEEEKKAAEAKKQQQAANQEMQI